MCVCVWEREREREREREIQIGNKAENFLIDSFNISFLDDRFPKSNNNIGMRIPQNVHSES